MTKRKARNDGANSYNSQQHDNIYVRELQRGRKYSFRLIIPSAEPGGKVTKTPMRKIEATGFADAFAQAHAYREGLTTAPDLASKTVAEYARMWFDDKAKLSNWSPLTAERVECEVKRIERHFGDAALKDLTPESISEHFAGIKDKTRCSDYTIGHCFKVLRRVLKTASDLGHIMRNPADTVDIKEPPRDEVRHAQKVMRPEDAERFARELALEERDGRVVALWIGIATGMRRGEVLALLWEDVDLENGIVYVRKQYGKEKVRKDPKKGSRRNIHIAPEVAKYLSEWKGEQAGALQSMGYAQTQKTPVCNSTRNDSPLNPDNFGKWQRNYYADHGFGRFKDVDEYTDKYGRTRYRKRDFEGPDFHSLRRAQATLLFSMGFDLKTVQGRLGWKRATMPLEVYAETVAENDATAADAVGAIFR